MICRFYGSAHPTLGSDSYSGIAAVVRCHFSRRPKVSETRLIHHRVEAAVISKRLRFHDVRLPVSAHRFTDRFRNSGGGALMSALAGKRTLLRQAGVGSASVSTPIFRESNLVAEAGKAGVAANGSDWGHE